MKWGILFRWQSFWIGAHWSPYNKRLCVNLIPMVTIWIAAPGGAEPIADHKNKVSPAVQQHLERSRERSRVIFEPVEIAAKLAQQLPSHVLRELAFLCSSAINEDQTADEFYKKARELLDKHTYNTTTRH